MKLVRPSLIKPTRRAFIVAAPAIIMAPSLAEAWWQSIQQKGVSGGGGGGFSLVAHTMANGSPSPVTTTGINTTGVTLIVIATDQYGGFAPATVSDSNSNTWTALTVRDSGAGPFTRLFYCTSPIVGSGHTFSLSDTGGFVAGHIAILAFNGGTGTFDVENGNTANVFGTSVQAGSVTPSVNNSLIVTCADADNSAATFTINSGFTITDTQDFGPTYGFGAAYFVQGTAAAINPTWSWTSGGSSNSAAIATFKP